MYAALSRRGLIFSQFIARFRDLDSPDGLAVYSRRIVGDRPTDAGLSPVPEEPPARDWSLLPLDALSSIFVKLTAVDILMGAGLVCRSWLEAAMVPDVWRVIEMDYTKIAVKMYSDMLHTMAKAAVDRSDGQLRVFAGRMFVTEELLKYIVERSPLLTTLRLVSCFSTLFSAQVTEVIRQSPLNELRSLELAKVDLTVEKLTAVLENCPVLEVLIVRDCPGMHEEDEHALRANFTRIKTLTFKCARYITVYYRS